MTNKHIHIAIEEQSKQHPDHIAAEGYGISLTYSMLNAFANQLAHQLIAETQTTGASVGVYAGGGPLQVTMLLATFKSAGVYIPMLPDQPLNRLLQAIRENNINVMLTSAEHYNSLLQLLANNTTPVKTIIIANISGDRLVMNVSHLAENGYADAVAVNALQRENPDLAYSDDSSAYVFYTSGSTGASKGIVGFHTALSHYIHWHKQEWSVDATFRISQLAPMTFDACLKDILTALSAGATVCMPAAEIKSNTILLVEWLRHEKITMLQTVPSLFRMITLALEETGEPLADLRYVVLAGERLYGRDVTKWMEVNGTQARLSNLYGLTETTILKTCYHIDNWSWSAGEVLPVGFPISNTLVAVINNGSLCVGGEIGEVYIKSPFISKGYLNKELNEQSLVQNPLEDQKQDLVWRTGDIGRYRDDNSLEILGRRDEQVKINGVRIELQQVRVALLEIPGILATELVVHTNEDFTQELICYYTGTCYTTEQLREKLSSELSATMLPGYFVWLPAFPLNMNGKVDRKALPRPQEMLVRAGFEEPLPGIEQELAMIWTKVLGVEQIGRTDNFFNVGGSSLKAIQVVSKVYKELNVQLTIAEIFSQPVLADMAALIIRQQPAIYQPIPKTAEQESYPLSSSQKRIWVLSQLENQSVAYNISTCYKLSGMLDIAALAGAFQRIAERHESIRTVFITKDGEPRQHILSNEQSGTGLVVRDFRTSASPEEQALEYAAQIGKQAFDLEKGPLFRIELLQTARREYLLVCCINHIISDEWSMKIMIREIIAFYNALADGKQIALPALSIQYRDYAVWQQEQLSGAVFGQHRQYWLSLFSGELPVLELPMDYTRPPVQQHRGAQLNIRFSPEISTAFRELLRQQDVTPFIGALTLINVLLYRYSGQSDIIIGTPVACREHPDLEDQIGYYLNTLALRNKIDPADNFTRLLQHVKKNTVEAFSHQIYPFDLLLEELGVRRELSRSSLFDVMIVWQSGHEDEKDAQTLLDVEVEQVPKKEVSNKFDLTFFFELTSDALELQLEYNTELYAPERISRMAVHLQELMSHIVAKPEAAVSTLQYISHEEYAKVTSLFNDTSLVLPNEGADLVSAFEKQVALHPAAVALVRDEMVLSFHELNERANQLANRLINVHNVKGNELVGISTARSEWLIIGILGILKAGAAYVPIDPEYPVERVRYITENSALRILLTDVPRESQLLPVEELLLNDPALLNGCSTSNPGIYPQPDDFAYVIYTSGSTGNPKGVMLQHSAVMNYINWSNQYYFDQNGSYVFPVFTSISFDLTVTSMLTGLYRGDAVRMYPQTDLMAALEAMFRQPVCNSLKITPAHIEILNSLSADLHHLEVIIVGGEELTRAHIDTLRSKTSARVKIFNEYGPTEATVGCVVTQVNDNQTAQTIGKPISNTQIYILDQWLQPQPVGVQGELCIAGDGLAKGYLNNELLTADRFIDNPFGEGKLYRTGDLACWGADGNIVFFGRKDNQVKIRGFRIELGEVEQTMLASSFINQVVVTVYSDSSGRSLAAYYTADNPVDEPALRAWLQQRLPYYMIPAYLVQLERLPLTQNGKIDRKALPAPGTQTRIYRPAVTEIERTIAAIWEGVLALPRIGLDDNFFELGGHSLKAIQVIHKIFKSLSVKLELGDMFMRPVLSQLADFVSKTRGDVYQPIPLAPEMDTYPLSNSQRRLWVISQLHDQSVAYNIPAFYKLHGAVDTAALAGAFRTLVTRHESLRTVFTLSEAEPRQKVLRTEDAGIELIIRDLRTAEAPEEQAKIFIQQVVDHTFDLEHGPLFKAELLQIADQEFMLVWCIHHIISDEWSTRVMIREIITLYNALHNNTEPGLRGFNIQYKDYAAWQQQELSGKVFASHRQYWLSRLSGDLPLLELPSDYKRPPVKQYNGAIVRSGFTPAQSEKFQQLLVEKSCTSFIGTLALVNVLLHRYSGQSDLIVGTPVAGREHPDLEDQIGYYLNTLALRNKISDDEPFSFILDHVRENTMEAFRHQAYPFDLLVDELGLRRDLSRSPLFDVLVVWMSGMEDEADELSLKDIEIEGLPWKNTISKFDMSFFFHKTSTGIQFLIEYNTDIYKAERVENIARHLRQLMEAVIAQPETSIASLRNLNAEEQDKVLYTFNQTATEWQVPAMDLVSCFEQQARIHGDKTALISQGKTFSYEDLNRSATLVAAYLRKEYGVNSNELIGISTARNEYLLIGILGILKAGAAYVPIDPDYPVDRSRYIVENSGLKILLTDKRTTGADLPVTAVMIADQSLYNGELSAMPAQAPKEDDIAYIIYTSGSTGKPKGVRVKHAAAVNVIHSVAAQLQLTPADRWVAITTYTFDMSVVEMFTPLLTGGCVILAGKDEVNNPDTLSSLLEDQAATVLQATPGMWNVLIESGWKGRQQLQVISGGEAMSETLISRLLALTGKVWNMYGPTETTVYSTALHVTSTAQVNLIGRPIANTQVYILDERLQPQPIGVPGELCIGGQGVAAGYLNNETLTADRFVANPYGPGVLYRTGDIARWHSTGDIEYQGRRDNQVKVRGYRIELGEIESSLLSSGLVSQAVVIVVGEGVEKTLAAYYVAVKEASASLLRSYLQSKLPNYMVPVHYIELRELPLTANGKIDRKALPQPNQQARHYKAPETETEKRLAAIWTSVLACDQVGLDDNFFETGGSSLKAMQLISRISQELDVKLPFSRIMQYPTIKALATLFNADGKLIEVSPVMELASTTAGKPSLYLFSPLIGTPIVYQALCNTLSKVYNCYGLQDAGFDDEEKTDRSIADKVSYFVKHIQQHAKTKKVQLLGFSYGATIAFEAARELELRGFEVDLIVMDRPVLRKKPLFTLRKNTVEDDLNWFIDHIKQIDPSLTHTEAIQANWDNNVKIIDNYRQQGKINGQIIAFKSRENMQKDFLSMEDWAAFTNGNFEHHYLNGDHYQSLELQENIDNIFKRLKKEYKAQEVKMDY
jgi:tyrocidine synthetase III